MPDRTIQKSAQDDGQPTKAWASGRVLTSAQRERKQKMDRISKQLGHQRQREHIRGLETRICCLEKIYSNFFSDCHMADVDPALSCSSSSETTRPNHNPLSFQDSTATSYLQIPSSIPAKDQKPTQSRRINDLPSAFIPPMEQSGANDMKYSRQAIEILGSVYALHPSQVCSDDHLNQDILIRAILYGWHTLENTSNDPIWDIVKKIDASIDIRSGIMTRLTMLRGIHQLLLCIIFPPLIGTLPAWYRPRPSQLLQPHEIVLDYFAWPGFRERLILLHRPLLDDSFWDHFAKSFHFSWPFSLRYAYEFDSANDRYKFSGHFLESMHDLRRYGMNSAFFAAYPETYDDIY